MTRESSKRTPRELAEKLANDFTNEYMNQRPSSINAFDHLERNLTDTLTPLLEEIDAARKMRDSLVFTEEFTEKDLAKYKIGQLFLAYDAIRTANERNKL